MSNPFICQERKSAASEVMLVRETGGSVKQKRLPCPGIPVLSAQIRPPIASTICLLTYNPSPVPGTVPERSRLRRTNCPNNSGSSSGGMPGPASCTLIHTCEVISLEGAALTITRVSIGEYLQA